MRQVIIKRIILKMEIFFSNDFYEKKTIFFSFFLIFRFAESFLEFLFSFFHFRPINID